MTCVECCRYTNVAELQAFLRSRLVEQPRCEYAQRWLSNIELGERGPFLCTDCVWDRAMAQRRANSQVQLILKSKELGWTAIKAALRVPLRVTFESGRLLVATARGLEACTARGTASFSVLVLNGSLVTQVTGSDTWAKTLKGSEWAEEGSGGVEQAGAATALRGALRMYSAATAQWAGGVVPEEFSDDVDAECAGSGRVEWGLVVVANETAWATAQFVVERDALQVVQLCGSAP